MIPIHCLTQSSPPPALLGPPDTTKDGRRPQDGIRYLLAKSGIYKQVSNPFYTACVKVAGIGQFEDTAENVKLHVPKLPLALFRQAEAFFAAVYGKHEAEAVVLLLANPVLGEWRMEVPSQQIREGSLHVAYDPASVIAPDGFEVFGTMHSHAGTKAFHSGTDDHDEVCSDGLHITIGNLGEPVRSYAARWMICGQAFTASLADVVESPPLPPVDLAWLDKVEALSPPPDFGLWGEISGCGTATPGVDPDIPPDMADEYEEYMFEAHQRFLNHIPSPR